MPKFRPILSAINIPRYNLAKFLIPILEPLTHNEFTVKDSFSFAEEITKYDSSLFMASLNVESLFTNIPLKETINNCVSDLHNKNLCNGKLNKSDLFKLLETATSESSFIFDFLPYKQINNFRHYESYIDQSYKKPLIFTLLSRCYSICSDYTLFHLEVEKLREILKKNSYPSGIIELSIRTF